MITWTEMVGLLMSGYRGNNLVIFSEKPRMSNFGKHSRKM